MSNIFLIVRIDFITAYHLKCTVLGIGDEWESGRKK